MGLDCYTFEIQYDINQDKFSVIGDLNKHGQEELIDTWLRMQMGRGKDHSPANKLDVYKIRLQWTPHMDVISVKDNTGNKGLREGILMRYLSTLD